MIIRRPLQILACCAALGVSRGAMAQADVTIGYAGLPSKSPLGTGTGLQVSDSVMLHAGVGAEVGYDSNVFYADKVGVVGSPVAIVVPYLEFTNASRTGAPPAGVFFEIEGSAGFRRYLSDADQVNGMGTPTGKKASDQPGFLPTANGILEFSSGQSLSLAFQDFFSRYEDAPYVLSVNPSSPLIHYSNDASAQLRWAPGGGRIQGVLRYANHFDAFNEQSGFGFADAISHQVSVDLSWKWLPKTALFLNVSQGYVTYLNDQSGNSPDTKKVSSYPLHLLAGLRGLITRKTSVNLSVGYANAFYSDGPSPYGLAGHLSANVDLTVSPTLLNSFGLGYHHDFQNSIVGNYYNVDSVTAWAQQQVGGRLFAGVSGRYEHRAFQFAASSRADNFVQVGAVADYRPKSWGYLGVGYSLLYNQAGTPTSDTGPAGATYVKHQIFARLGVTY